MNRIKISLFAVCMAFVVLSGCEKTEKVTDPPEDTTQDQSNPLPDFPDADGVLAAVQSFTEAFPGFNITTDAATAVFINGANFYDAGTVSVNAFDLSKLSNNTYVLPAPGNLQLDFNFDAGNSPSWNISGSANVPAFMHTTNTVMTGNIKLVGDYSTVDPSNDLVVTIDAFPSDADSVLFLVSYGDTSITKSIGSGTSATFMASEIANATGTGVVQAAGYNYEKVTQSGKNFYFINESVATAFSEFKK